MLGDMTTWCLMGWTKPGDGACRCCICWLPSVDVVVLVFVPKAAAVDDDDVVVVAAAKLALNDPELMRLKLLSSAPPPLSLFDGCWQS